MSRINARSTATTIVLFALLAAKAQEFYEAQDADQNQQVSAVNSKEIKFKVDTALLTVIINPENSGNKLDSPVIIYFLSDYCHTCKEYEIGRVSGEHKHLNTSFLIDTRWNSNLVILKNATANEAKCNFTLSHHFKERAEYELKINITKDGCDGPYKIKRLTDPYHTNLPIAVAASILLGLAIIYKIIDKLYQNREDGYGSVERFINSDLGSTGDIDNAPTPPARPARERMTSVDTFRGLCIVIMVFVNYKGGRYWFFHHSAWHGLTVADLVFPWFMFIMGINIVLSIDSLIRKATPEWEIAYKIIRRTLILFFLGLCIINHNTNFENMRIPGVLQRFAVAYCIVSLMQWAFHKPVPDMTTMVVMATSDEGVKPWWYQIRDIIVYWAQWLIIVCFETAWHFLTFKLPVENCPLGYLGPGGLSEDGKNFNCIGGAAGYIDRKVFGVKHMYLHPTAVPIYYPPNYNEGVPFDPEGLLGSFHSILIVFMGLQAGKIFLYYKEPKDRIVRWLAWSLFMGVISAALTKCSQYDGWIPVNKNLWSTSFVTTLSCFAYFILAVMYYVIDIKKWWSGVPFYFVGMNSIFIYVGHEVFEGYLPFAWGAGATSTHAELLAMNMIGTACWVVIAYYCYKIKFFVKI